MQIGYLCIQVTTLCTITFVGWSNVVFVGPWDTFTSLPKHLLPWLKDWIVQMGPICISLLVSSDLAEFQFSMGNNAFLSILTVKTNFMLRVEEV